MQFSLFDQVVGKASGLLGDDVAYELVDKVFTKKLFTLVSMSGHSRSGQTKECFNRFQRTMDFFYNLVLRSDSNYAVTASRKFFQKQISNSRRRFEKPGVRSSRVKRRITPTSKRRRKENDEYDNDHDGQRNQDDDSDSNQSDDDGKNNTIAEYAEIIISDGDRTVDGESKRSGDNNSETIVEAIADNAAVISTPAAMIIENNMPPSFVPNVTELSSVPFDSNGINQQPLRPKLLDVKQQQPGTSTTQENAQILKWLNPNGQN